MKQHPNRFHWINLLKEAFRVIKRKFCLDDLHRKKIVIATTNVPEVNKKVQEACNRRQILVNVADTPELCDFYMGGIVTKGNLKIGFYQWKISNPC